MTAVNCTDNPPAFYRHVVSTRSNAKGFICWKALHQHLIAPNCSWHIWTLRLLPPPQYLEPVDLPACRCRRVRYSTASNGASMGKHLSKTRLPFRTIASMSLLMRAMQFYHLPSEMSQIGV